MATILRYIKHLKKVNNVGWRVIVNQPPIEATGVKLGFASQIVDPELTRSYATRAATRSAPLVYGFDKSIQNLEAQVKRSGRLIKFDLEKVVADLQTTGGLTSLDALFLIRSCGKPLIDADFKESIELVQEIWELLERLQIPVDVSHFNALLTVYLEKEHNFCPKEFLASMSQKSVEPNRVTYQRLIAAYCQQGDIVGATHILGAMKEKNMPLTEEVFNSLIIGHSQAGDMDNALGILKTMSTAGIEPSANTYAALMNVYAKKGDMDSIMATLNKLENSEICILDTHLIDVIYTLVANGHVSIAEELCNKLPNDVVSDTEVARLLTKLVNLNQLPLAMKILKKTATDPLRLKIRSTFIITAACKNPKISADEIINMCVDMQSGNLKSDAFQVAIYRSILNNAEPSEIMTMMRAWKKQGKEMHDHFFWPLLRIHARANNNDAMLDVLKIMKDDFGITPSLDTLRDYTIPYMFGTWEEIIDRLEPLGISRDTVLTAIADRCILDRKLRNAAIFMTAHPIKYSKEIFIPHLATTFGAHNDTKSFVVVMRFLNDKAEEISQDNIPTELVDAALAEVMKVTPRFKYIDVIQILEEIKISGLSISSEMGKQIKAYLEDNLTPQYDELIDKLASGTLKEVPMSEYNSYINAQPVVNNSVRSDAIDLRRSFAYNLEIKNEAKVIELLRQMDSMGYESAPVYAQAIDFFCETENLEGAETYMKKLKNMGTAKLDHRKMIQYTTLLIKKNRFNDAVAYLNEQEESENDIKLSRGLTVAARDLLSTIAETKDVENLHKIFNMLLSKNFIDIDSYTLGPLVRIHILREDLNKAVETFERACIDYKCTPFKNVLATKLIEAEDANLLQKVTDLCTEIHGESNALVDLALVFLECGRIRQARKIFETSGIQVWNDKITNAIQRFDKLGKSELLEQFVYLTQNVLRMDRGHMFRNILDLYKSKNDWKSGLALWTLMQETDVQPTKEFLDELSTLLTKNDQKVPFVHDAQPSIHNVKTAPIEQRKRTSTVYVDPQFDEMLNRKDFAAAETMASSENNVQERVRKYCSLIRNLLSEDKLDQALDCTRKLLQRDRNISRTTFIEISNKLISTARYNDFDNLGTMLDERVKNRVQFYKMMSNVGVAKYGLKTYLSSFVLPTSNNTNPENYIHFGAISLSLLKDGSALPEVEAFANMLLEKNIFRGKHVLWTYNFVKNTPQERDLWNQFITKSNSPLFRPIIEHATEIQDVALAERLEERLARHPNLSINSQCRLISSMIRIYNAVDRYDDGLKVLEKALSRYHISLLSFTALDELRKGLERSGKPFPYRFKEPQINSGNERTQQNPQREFATL